MKVFADNKMKVAKMMTFVLDREENMWKKVKLLVTSIFAFSRMFSKGFLLRVIKSWDCVEKS